MKTFKEIKNEFLLRLEDFPLVDDKLSIQILGMEHTSTIVKWRNDQDNLKLFEANNKVTFESQILFLNKYETLNRVDIILLYDNRPIGIFNIKNLDSEPEYGSLIGEKEFRGLGYGNLFKKAIFKYWFDVLGHKKIYAKIKKANQFLINSNLRKGFKVIRVENELNVLELHISNYER